MQQKSKQTYLGTTVAYKTIFMTRFGGDYIWRTLAAVLLSAAHTRNVLCCLVWAPRYVFPNQVSAGYRQRFRERSGNKYKSEISRKTLKYQRNIMIKNFRKSAILEQSPCASNSLCFVLVSSYLILYLVTLRVFIGRGSQGQEKLFYGSSTGEKVGKQYPQYLLEENAEKKCLGTEFEGEYLYLRHMKQ